MELGNTYTTRFQAVNKVTYPVFAFDYPSNWTISDPEIDSFREIVALTNERGVVIRHAQLDRGSVSGDGTWRMDIEKVADSSFIPDYVQATDLRGLGTFMVASAVCTGSLSGDGSYADIANSPMNYAVLPESRVGVAEGLRGDNSSALSFNYAASLSFATVDVQGGLTPRETREVIAILSSFRTA